MADAPKSNKTVTVDTTSPGMSIPMKVPMMSQLGSTGLKEYSGYISEDFLANLRGREAVRIYFEMANNDPIVGAVLFACAMMLRQADWRVEPADDSKQSEQAQKFVEECIEDMSHSWAEFIEEVTSMLPYGYAVFEVVYKIRGGSDTDDPKRKSRFDDGRIGIRKLAPRSQDSVLRWLFSSETGNLIGMEQLTDTGKHAIIPAAKMLLFRTTSQKDNPEGKSILRNSYVSYIRKKAIEDAEGRAALRSAGIVMLRIPGRMMSPDADEAEQAVYATFKQLATTLSRDQQGALILPSDRDASGNPLYEMQYVIGDGRRPADFSGIIRRFDEAIATSVLADFVLLGQSSGMHGSHAMSQNKTDIFSQALNAYLKGIEEVLNRHLLPRLWNLNNFDEKVMPKIKAEPVEVPDLNTLATYITALATAGARMFPDDELEEHLREIADMPPVADTAKAGTPQIQQQAKQAEMSMQAGMQPGGAPQGGVQQKPTPNSQPKPKPTAQKKPAKPSK